MSRFHPRDERVQVDATSPDFYAALSGGVVRGEVFVPDCYAKRGSRLRLRIRLPSGETVKADGTVSHLRDNAIPPGCIVSWVATKSAVRDWLASGR